MNRVPRVYLPATSFIDHVVRPTEEAAHYLTRVLRLRAGDQWAALDGERRSWLCELVDSNRSNKVGDWDAVAPLPVQVEVGLSLCKGARFEDALEKLAELGVVRVVPLESERTERGLPSSAKFRRWTQIALSSSALANRMVPMTVSPAMDLQKYVAQLDPAVAVYCHHDGASRSEVFRFPRNVYTIVIGPEGGFSPAELEGLQGRAKRVSLGPLTLRVETAAVCAVSLALGGADPHS